MLPDGLWAKIHGAFNLLCGVRIAELIETLEEFDYFHLVKLDGPTKRYPDMTELFDRMEERKRKRFAQQ